MSLSRSTVAALLIVMLLGLAGAASADLLFDRGLPAININNAAGTARSNVTWASTEDGGFTGDDFVIGTAGQTYKIDSITVWGAQFDPLSLDIDNIALYVSKYDDPLALVSSGSVTGNTNSNPSIAHTYVSYPDGTDVYEGNGGVLYPICQTTFSGLDMLVEGGVKYKFGVIGDKYLWWSHASNADLSGSPQDGADNLYLEFNLNDLSQIIVWDSNGDGWDKSSDINIQISGEQVPPVPEPMSIFLGIMGLGSIAGFKRFRR